MNTRVRTAVQTMKAPAKLDNKVAKSPSLRKNVKERQELLLNRLANSQRTINPRASSRDRKKALQQDVEKLKKKLRHEENVHRALERAFTRPLGALPRLPPYLPPQTLELLAEVAVLEEEVVRLEEKVVNFRQGLYQEALYISSSKRSTESTSDSFEQSSNSFKLEQSKSFAQVVDLDAAVSQPLHSMIDGPAKPPVDQSGHSSSPPVKGNKNLKKNNSPSVFCEGKENQSNANSTIKCKQASLQKTKRKNIFRKKLHLESDASENCSEPIQPENRAMAQERAEDSPASGISMSLSTQENPNKIAEDVLKCLMSIFSRMNNPKATALEAEMPISASRFTSCEGSEATQFGDPYGMCFDFGEREIGPYKHLQAIEGSSVVPDWITSSSFLIQRLKCLLSRLASVDLRGLTHQQKLAFWINVYNSCMMNAYLEHGIPGSPQLVVALIQKAMINVSGHLLNALTIEHFILRLPYSKYTNPKGVKNDDAAMRSIFSLDWPEPLVTFALSCGSWSSPAVRVYSATHVENELEIAKRDYLQAAIGISLTKVAIPKLLDCYLLDFAKDIESLLDWICLQLPDEMRKDAIKCLERGREEKTSQWVYVSPYEFCFRYLLGP